LHGWAVPCGGRGTASAAQLSPATIKAYVSRLLTKLDLRDRVQLTVLAHECGVVVPGETGTGDK